MATPSLPLCTLLDPRPAETARREPYSQAVNIPLEEIKSRVYELPRKSSVIDLAGPEDVAIRAQAVLTELGWNSRLAGSVDISQERESGRLWSPNSFLEDQYPHLAPGKMLDL